MKKAYLYMYLYLLFLSLHNYGQILLKQVSHVK